MPVAARKNTISEGESPISSVKYNEEMDNLYFALNKSLSFFSGTSAPDEPMLNQYWLDTASNPAVLRRYDGSVWRWTGIHFGTTAPLNPISGAFFINSDAGTMAFWDGTEWQSLPGTAIGFDPTGTDLASMNLEDALKEMYVSYLDTLAQAEIAVTAAGQASGYATAADEARAAAVVAQGLAEGAETGAVAAQGFAELAQGFAEDAQTDAENARDKAEDWAEEAEDTEVEAGKYSAKHWSAKSEGHSDKAHQWAEEEEDTPVETGEYSAKHWAAKAAASALAAEGIFEIETGTVQMMTPMPLNMASEALTGLPVPSADSDAATKAYVDGKTPAIEVGDDGKFMAVVSGAFALVDEPNSLPDITAPADNGKFLSVVEGASAWVPAPNSLPDITAPADNGKFLSVVEGDSAWVPAPNSLPDITIDDEDRVLAVQSGEAAWIDAPSSLPDITVGDEGKALAVIDGVSKWCDPLEELGVGTGFFELDDDLNIVPKAKSQLYSEINLGSGHFEFTGEGDLRMKSGGDYRVGSTLPLHNAGDNGKVLQVSAGEPAWGVGVPVPSAGDEGKSIVVSEALGYELGAGGSDLLGTAVYARSEPFARDSANTLATPLAKVEVDGSLLSFAAGTLSLDTEASWDASTYATPANRSGKDFYVYATADGLLLSANTTYPTGYTATTSRKIGGFHCLCVNVGTISGHPLSGFLAGDILPASVWDLNHRPICSPEGMVYSQTAGIWVDIYLQSGTGASTKSVNGGTITDTRTWMDFVDDLGAVGKRLLDDGEFQKIAAGGNEETNIAGSADPGTTTGHTDTAGRRMISSIGCEDCAGVVYQWLLDQSYRVGTGAEWDWYDLPGAKGSLYNYSTAGNADIKLLAGGYWTDGASCGSRCRYAVGYRWSVNSIIGARGCCGAVFG